MRAAQAPARARSTRQPLGPVSQAAPVELLGPGSQAGDRLRDWMGISREEFYDRSRVAIVPMGFCFPGYDAKGADIPPPAICAAVTAKAGSPICCQAGGWPPRAASRSAS